jgi:hypothetical protein
MNLEQAIEKEARAIRADWLGEVDRAKDWTAAGYDALPPRARADSAMWSDRFFALHAGPHNRALKAKTSYHSADDDAPDLLRFEYTVSGIPVVVTESRNYVVVRAKAAPKDAARVLQELLVRALPIPATPADGMTFTSNPAAHPILMKSWEDRFDGGIQGGTVWFLLYKKHEQRAGYESATGWFEDTYR